MTNREAADILIGKSELEILKSNMVNWAEEMIGIVGRGGQVKWDVEISPLTTSGNYIKTWVIRAIFYREDQ